MKTRDLDVSTKIYASFALILIVIVGMGVLVLRSLSQVGSQFERVAVGDLKTANTEAQLTENTKALDADSRLLLSPELDAATRIEIVGRIRGRVEQIETIIQSLGELQTSDQIRTRLDLIAEQIEAYLGQGQVIDQFQQAIADNDVPNPFRLAKDLQSFRGDHLDAQVATLKGIRDGRAFSYVGPTQCAFGRWLNSFSTNNPALQDYLNRVRATHDEFHRSMADIAETIEQGDDDQAFEIFASRMEPAATQVIGTFSQMAQTASDANQPFVQANDIVVAQLVPFSQEIEKLASDLKDALGGGGYRLGSARSVGPIRRDTHRDYCCSYCLYLSRTIGRDACA